MKSQRKKEMRRTSIAIASLTLLALAGCQTYRPTPILVRDAETGRPVAGAEVHVSYPLANSIFAPAPSCDLSGADGIARVRAAPYGDAGLRVQTSAKGYLTDNKYLSIDEVSALEPAHWFEDVGQRGVVFVVDLLAEPAPNVEVIVPASFKGIAKIDVHIQDDMSCPAGQRSFPCPLSALGEAAISLPPMLRRASPATFRAQFTDGSAIGRPDDQKTTGFWWLKSEGNTHYYVVGRRYEYEAELRALQPRRKRGRSSADGQQGQSRGHCQGRGNASLPR
jgi:hypothetical protein